MEDEFLEPTGTSQVMEGLSSKVYEELVDIVPSDVPAALAAVELQD